MALMAFVRNRQNKVSVEITKLQEVWSYCHQLDDAKLITIVFM